MRVIIVHNFDQAKEVLSLGKNVTLQTAPDAIHYAGALYLHTVLTQAKAAYPNTPCTAILDCSDDGAQTIEAIGLGQTHLRSSAAPELLEKLRDIAAQHGATIYTDSYEALDLHHVRDTKTACEQWLTTEEQA